MSAALKFSTTTLNYPYLKGVPTDRVDTHLLRSEGDNALLLAGDTAIEVYKKWGDGEGGILRNT